MTLNSRTELQGLYDKRVSIEISNISLFLLLGSSQILLQDSISVLYPKIPSTETLECDCGDITCDSVYWFRSISNQSKIQFLGRCNNADRVNYGAGVNEARFKFNKRGSSSFVLRIINVTEIDTGIYSCVVKEKSNMELWKAGTLLLPGVTPPTPPPKIKPKPPVKPVCSCSNEEISQDGCGSLVLWPLVGLITGLALALVCTLYYFSRE
uniref:Immunoglobulin V-set domain-containing protein n=1 Tax=Monopterus albus TaxID=43700 RepID=A0A3Q3IGD3_MONAL